MSLPASMQASTKASKQSFRFEGFDSPNGTIVPDDFFDLLAPELSEAELRVCLYIIRRTFGFKKRSDDISLRQMVEGDPDEGRPRARPWRRRGEVIGRQGDRRPGGQGSRGCAPQ